MLSVSKVKETATRNNLWTVNQMADAIEGYNKDTHKEIRISKKMCKHCFYIPSSVSGSLSAITIWNCAVCGHPDSHSNLNVPKICSQCSDKHNMCLRCGADMEK